jgi:carbon storage regulator
MLIMRRREGESILIGEDIEIQIIHAGPSRVKIGIVAPRSIPVVTKESKLVRRQNVAAAQSRPVAAWRAMLDRLARPDAG